MSDKQIAVFDFDGTLTKRDSFISFARFATGTPKFILSLMLSGIDILKWKTGMTDSSAAKEKLFGRLFRGMHIDEFRQFGERFADYIDKNKRPETADALREFIRKGIPVIILTASVPAWIEPWAHRIGVSSVIGTEVETDGEGFLTGRFRSPNCRGEEKVRRLAEAFPDLDSYEIWAYGDSSGDDALLALSDHPRRVRTSLF